jgi:predicted metal-dependent phosphoesterase TrpH
MSFAIDLHVHTRRYSPCAELMREEHLAEHGRRAGLAGLVVTEHDALWRLEELGALRERADCFRLYRGVECTADGAHLVVIGLDDLGSLVRGASVDAVVDHARSQGAAVILAHPYRDADPERLPVERIDAVEVGSTSFTVEEARRAEELARRFGKPTVAASDAHSPSRIGWAWTSFPRLPADEAELARMIREGAGVPWVPRPFPP